MALTVTLVDPGDRQIEELLRAAGAVCTSISAENLSTLVHSSARQPDVVVLDLRQSFELPSALAAFKRQHSSTGVVIVGSRLDPHLMLEAMRAGVNEWVTEPLTQTDLEAAIARVVAQHATTATGQVFAFVGAKGGVGATTVAVNVATVLAKVAPGQTLLVDLHLAYGDAALFLGCEPRFSVVDALENTHRFDEAFFRGLVVRTKSGLDVLASSDRASVTPTDVRRIRALIEFAAGHYRYTIVDVPRSDTAVLDALEAAVKIVVVANQELAAVRSAGRMAATLRHRYGKDKVTVVLSRSDRQAEIGHEDVERAVGDPVKYTFPSDYRLALQALNRGRPLVLDNHTELATSFYGFAWDLAEIVGEKPAAPRGAGIFGRLTGRRTS